MSDVAVAILVSPLSMATCEVEVSPDTVIKPPGTVIPAVVVVASSRRLRRRRSRSRCADPIPVDVVSGVMVSVTVWLPLIDSACTGGGTSFLGSVGGALLQPSASNEVPMAPRSMVCERAWASSFSYWSQRRRQHDGVVQPTGGRRQRDEA